MAQPSVSLKKVQSHWKTLLNVTRLRHRNLRTLLEDGEPVGVAGREVFIRFKYPSHKNEVEKEFNRQVLEERLGQLVGQSIQVYCVLPDEWERLKPLISAGKGHWEIIAGLQQEIKGLRDRILQWDVLRKDLGKLKRERTRFHKERADLQQEAKNLQDEIRRQGATLTELEFKQRQLKAQVTEMEQRKGELSSLLQSLGTRERGHRETLVDLRGKVNNLQGEIRRREATLEELELEQELLETQVKEMEQRKDELLDSLQSLETETQEHKVTLPDLRQEAKSLKDRIRQRKDWIAELDAARAEYKKFYAKKEQLEAQVVQSQHQADDLQNRLKPLETQVRELEEERTNLKREVENLQDEICRQKDTLEKIEASEANLAELDTQLQDRRSRIVSTEQRLGELQTEQRQYEEQLADLGRQIEDAGTNLARLLAQDRGLLWQAVLRTDLDAGELTPYANSILDRLGRADPAKAAAFRLEIAARTGRAELPPHDVKELSGLPHLFADVIQARAVGRDGDLTAAVQTLCDSWEAVLPTEPESDQAPSPPSEPQVKAVHPPVYVSGQYSTLTLEVNGVQVLVDPGPDYVIPDDHPDLVVVTHAHNDHVDQLLPLCERFPDLPVVMTPETSELLGLSLNRWAMIQERQVHCLPVGETRRIEGVKVLLHPAGHLLGAAMVDLNLEVARILVTGDFSLRPVGGLSPVKLPPSSYDLVLMEAVHASENEFPFPKPQDNRWLYLIQRVLRAIKEGYTRVLIIAAALGDAQEVYDALLQAQKDPRASTLADYAICLKGKAHRVARLYAQAGMWERSVPDECPDRPAQRTIVIASGGAANPLRQQFSTLQHALVFEPYKSAASSLSTERDRRYQVDLHASLAELIHLGQRVQCGVIGLYHAYTGNSILEQKLRSAGKRVINVATADRMYIGLDGDK